MFYISFEIADGRVKVKDLLLILEDSLFQTDEINVFFLYLYSDCLLLLHVLLFPMFGKPSVEN